MRKSGFVILLTIFGRSLFAQSEDSPLYNPLAYSSTYDPGLNIGDSCVVVDKGMGQKTMKIHDKKNGMYRVAVFDITDWEIKNQQNSVKWYKANSVYPYYDYKLFQSRVSPYKETIESLMKCFGEAKGIDLQALSGSTQWPTYYIKDDAEYNKMKADLEGCAKVMDGFKHLPNTFLPYSQNPAIWYAITQESIKYLDCLKGVGNPEIKRTVDRIISEIETAKTTATNFTGGTEGLFNCSSCHDYMFCAVSADYRKDFFGAKTGWNSDQESVDRINKALDELKLICAPKISLLKLADRYFKYTLDGTSESVMKSYLKNASSLTIYKKGSSDADWQIERNAYGIILYRYKRTQMWIKNPNADHSYCKGLFYVLKSDYNGSSYGNSFVSEYNEQLCGCP
jgi:hypothetical protein